MIEAATMSNLFGGGPLGGFVAVLNYLMPGISPWKAEKTDAGIAVSRTVRSVVEHVLLDEKWMQSREERHELQVLVPRNEVDVERPGAVDAAVVGNEADALSAQRRGHVSEENLDAGAHHSERQSRRRRRQLAARREEDRDADEGFHHHSL